MNERLYRSRDDRVISGVAGGVADLLNVDPSLVRVLWVVLAILTGGILFVLYIIMMIVVPEEPVDWPATNATSYGPPPAAPVPPATTWGSAPATSWAASVPPAPESYGTPGGATSADAATGADAAGSGSGSADSFAPPTATAATGAPEPAPATAPAQGATDAAIPGWNATTPGWTPAAGSTDWRSARSAERWARREQRRAERAARRERNDGFGAVIFGVLLILVGGFFLLRTYYPSIDTDRLWPIILVVIGAVFVIGALRPGSGPDERQ